MKKADITIFRWRYVKKQPIFLMKTFEGKVEPVGTSGKGMLMLSGGVSSPVAMAI